MGSPERVLARAGERTPAEPRIDGTLDGYIDHALRQSPGLRAAYEDWRAALLEVSERRRLPEPMLGVGVSAGSQRVMVSQRIPWPTRRRAAAAAAAGMAEAGERRLEAEALDVIRRVADAYWQLWTVQRMREVEGEQRMLLFAVAELVRTRLAVGKASLADAARLDLEVARRDDALAGLDERELAARAMLRRAIGAAADVDVELPIVAAAPEAEIPAEDAAALREAARAHPRVVALATMAAAQDQAVRAARAEALPDVTVGLEYMTGDSAHDPRAGDDPLMVTVGVMLPIWRGTYRDAERKAQAEAAALRARQHDAALMAEAEVDAALAQIRDAARRIATYETTLKPQAGVAYEAVIASFQVGGATLNDVLGAHGSVLELERELVMARADHARAWARLVELVGRPVAPRPWSPGQKISLPQSTTPEETRP